MKYRFNTIIFYFLILVSGSVFGQTGAVLKLNTFRHDFGKILEKDGKVSHSFPVENTGDDTLRIIRLKTSGLNVEGTMLPDKIAPGASGLILVAFDPANEKGKVEKFVSIRSNDSQFPVRQLGFLAEVIPYERTLADQYPVRLGNLKLKIHHIGFDQFLNTEVRSDTFRLYNDWSKPMTLQIKNPPDYTTWVCDPKELKPGKEGRIIVTYDAGKSDNWGLSQESVTLMTNDSLEPEKKLTLGLNIIEDFSYLKGKPDSRPVVSFETSTHDFGKVRQGRLVTFSFSVENKGKGELIIRKTKAGCGCTVVVPEKKNLLAGEKTNIKVSFNTVGMEGFQSKSVTVITNDPDKPLTVLTISANIE